MLRKFIFYFIFIFLITKNLFAQKQGQEKIDSLIIELRKSAIDTNKINILNDLAWELKGINADSSIQLSQSAVELSKQIKWNKGISLSYYELGEFSRRKGDYENALSFNEKSLAIAKEINDQSRIAKAYGSIAIVYDEQSNQKKALEYYNKALILNEELENKSGIATVLGNIGTLYKRMGDYSKAMDYHFRQLNLNEELKDTFRIGVTMLNIGIEFYDRADYKKALDYELKGLEMVRSSNDKFVIGYCLSSIANIYYMQNKFQMALEYYSESLKLNEAIGSKKRIASSLMDIGNVHESLGNFSDALSFFYRALKIQEEIKDRSGKCYTLYNIGHTLLNENKLKEAETYSLQSLNAANEINSIDQQRVAHELLSNVYEKSGKVAEALKQLKITMTLKDSIFNKDKTKEITQLEMQYIFDKQQDSIQVAQDKKDAITKSELEKQKVWRNSIAGGSAILLLSSILIFYYYKRNRDSEEKRKEISNSLLISETEMKALQAQMNPHFIFNALNSIRKFLANHKSDETDTYIKKFQELMRFVLENSTSQEVPLKDDLSALRSYMEFERLRLEYPFAFEINVDDKIDQENIMIPPLILQPFVENAIWHGLQPKHEPGFVKINISMENDTINCVVEDNGIGRDLNKPVDEPMVIKKKSLGMKITEQRLKIYSSYKNVRAWFKIIDLQNPERKPTGTRVELYLPLFA